MNKKCCVAEHAESRQAQGRTLWTRCLVAISLIASTLVAMSVLASRVQGSPSRNASNLRPWVSRYAHLPLSFELNRGQTDARVKYLARGQGYTLFLTGHEAVMTLRREKNGSKGKSSSVAALRLRLLGAASTVRITGEDQLAGYSSYFLGNNPKEWHTQIPNYGRIRYHQVYPGIDLVYYGRRGNWRTILSCRRELIRRRSGWD